MQAQDFNFYKNEAWDASKENKDISIIILNTLVDSSSKLSCKLQLNLNDFSTKEVDSVSRKDHLNSTIIFNL